VTALRGGNERFTGSTLLQKKKKTFVAIAIETVIVLIYAFLSAFVCSKTHCMLVSS
jgi:hypothetical protein